MEDYTEKNTVEIINNEIYFYADIDRDSLLDLKEKVYEVRKEDHSKTISIHLNTSGGKCTDGLEAYDFIKRIYNKVYIYLEGYVASMGTIIACAGDKIIMSKNAIYMLHDINYSVQGTHNEVKDRVEMNNKITENMYNIYSEKTGLSLKKLKKLISRKDLYLNAQEALNYGFVDEILGG